MFGLDLSKGKRDVSKNYKWVALSNTTMGGFMVALDGSCVLIALPAIFRGINLNPMGPESSAYLLWILTGYTLTLAVLVVTLGRVGDMFGRVRMYNLGFVIFSVGSILLSLTWSTGPAGAIELIIFRALQAVGGACLFANSAAILTDAFPSNQRGLALGINQMSFIAGSLLGIIAGGLLAEVGWRWVFRVSIPVAVAGTVWAYVALREIGVHKKTKIDWIGNLTFAAGLAMILIGITYGIQSHGTSAMSWNTPFVLSMLFGGIAALVAFVFVEQRVEEPMFRISLFRIRAFSAGNVATILSSIASGGMSFMVSIWLQGIWLPLHGYDFEVTPFWAGIFMLPQTAGFLLVGPISGYLSDRFGARLFATGGMVVAAAAFALMALLPVNLLYWQFALVLALMGVGMGLFGSPNMAAIMNSVPPENRGVGSGMRSAFFNVGSPLSNGVFFSLMTVGLSATMPVAMYTGLTQNGVSVATASQLAHLPPLDYTLAALMGFNPIGKLLGPQVLNSLPAATGQQLTSRSFFPQLISASFHHGLALVLTFSMVVCLVAAGASWVRGKRFVYEREPQTEGTEDAQAGQAVRGIAPGDTRLD
jgi:EmrB/QacA subfamily drug resistance transporter